MKRLVDEDLEHGSALRPLAELVRVVPPLAAASLVQQRAALARIRSAAVQQSHRPWFEASRLGANPPAVRRWVWGVSFGALLLSAVAVASVVRWHPHFASPWASGRLGPTSTRGPMAGVPSPSMVSVAPAVSAEPVPAPIASQAVEVPSVRLKLATKGTDRSPRLGGGEDPTLVLEAIAALRDRGDAARASALLADHLRAHPRGVLAEDALALAIEAALARRDAHAAADLGRRYVAQFPNGRYRAFAERAIEP